MRRLALRLREEPRPRELRLGRRLEPLVAEGALADPVEPERERLPARGVVAVQVPVAEALGERVRVDHALALRVARGRVVGEPHRAPLGDGALEPPEHRVAGGRRARVDPPDQLVEARAPIARDRVAQRLHRALAPLAAERLHRGGERGGLALGEARRAREALVQRDVDAVALDVQVEEVVGRERRGADLEEEVEVLEQLLLRAAAAPREVLHRDPGVAHRVRDEEQDAAEPVARVVPGRGGSVLPRGGAERSTPLRRAGRTGRLGGAGRGPRLLPPRRGHASPRSSPASTARAFSRSALRLEQLRAIPEREHVPEQPLLVRRLDLHERDAAVLREPRARPERCDDLGRHGRVEPDAAADRGVDVVLPGLARRERGEREVRARREVRACAARRRSR